MEKKKIFSKKILIPIIVLVLVISVTSIFLLNKKSNTKETQFVEPINNIALIEANINNDVLNLNVCVNYNGNYKFEAIADISIPNDITKENEYLIYKSFTGAEDKNSFLCYLYSQKIIDSKNEKISLINGKYTKSISSNKKEQGLYFGNADKSYIYIEDDSATIEIYGKKHKTGSEISLTGYWLPNPNNNQSKYIYIREKFYYDNINSSFIYVTYIYKMI